MIEDSMRKTLDGLCLQSGATADINYGHGYPALVNHEEDAELIRNTAIKLFGKDDVVDKTPGYAGGGLLLLSEREERRVCMARYR